jgi:hypothetical protein
MIVLNLLCANRHRFEGWFASGDAFADQARRGQVSCPFCQATEVTRLPSAPYVKRQQSGSAESNEAAQPVTTPEARYMSMLNKLFVESEDVGERFPEEARRIHYAEAPARKIRGKSSHAEAIELLEEGIPVMPLPIPPGGDTH